MHFVIYCIVNCSQLHLWKTIKFLLVLSICKWTIYIDLTIYSPSYYIYLNVLHNIYPNILHRQCEILQDHTWQRLVPVLVLFCSSSLHFVACRLVKACAVVLCWNLFCYVEGFCSYRICVVVVNYGIVIDLLCVKSCWSPYMYMFVVLYLFLLLYPYNYYTLYLIICLPTFLQARCLRTCLPQTQTATHSLQSYHLPLL